MKNKFLTLKKRMVTDLIPFTKEQFFEIMYAENTNEIYNENWSSKKPFIVITKYNENGMLLYCNAFADKTPKQKTIENLYYFLKYNGLSECYILTGVLAEKINLK